MQLILSSPRGTKWSGRADGVSMEISPRPLHAGSAWVGGWDRAMGGMEQCSGVGQGGRAGAGARTGTRIMGWLQHGAGTQGTAAIHSQHVSAVGTSSLPCGSLRN